MSLPKKDRTDEVNKLFIIYGFLDTTVGQIENGLKRGLVKHWLNYNVRLNNWPKEFDGDARLA